MRELDSSPFASVGDDRPDDALQPVTAADDGCTLAGAGRPGDALQPVTAADDGCTLAGAGRPGDAPHAGPTATDGPALAIVGAGRLGTALAAALHATGVPLRGPLGRGADVTRAPAVLLCVPDAEIAAAAAAVAPGPLVGHCSGATGLDVLAPHEGFSLHPLMTVPRDAAPDVFAGAGGAIAGTTPRALAYARALAEHLQLTVTEVTDADRAAYHAAAAIASNFLVTLEGAAERLAASAGVERALLVPLVLAAVRNWARLGAERALTGPIARGDEATVARQRDALAERAPDLLALWDALAAATRDLAAGVAR